jgi:hypothetical protein
MNSNITYQDNGLIYKMSDELQNENLFDFDIDPGDLEEDSEDDEFYIAKQIPIQVTHKINVIYTHNDISNEIKLTIKFYSDNDANYAKKYDYRQSKIHHELYDICYDKINDDAMYFNRRYIDIVATFIEECEDDSPTIDLINYKFSVEDTQNDYPQDEKAVTIKPPKYIKKKISSYSSMRGWTCDVHDDPARGLNYKNYTSIYYNLDANLCCCLPCSETDKGKEMIKTHNMVLKYDEYVPMNHIMSESKNILSIKYIPNDESENDGSQVNGVATIRYSDGSKYVGGFYKGNKHGDGISYEIGHRKEYCSPCYSNKRRNMPLEKEGPSYQRWSMFIEGHELKSMDNSYVRCSSSIDHYRRLWYQGKIGGIVGCSKYLAPLEIVAYEG